jgi:hypothetical protein
MYEKQLNYRNAQLLLNDRSPGIGPTEQQQNPPLSKRSSLIASASKTNNLYS